MHVIIFGVLGRPRARIRNDLFQLVSIAAACFPIFFVSPDCPSPR